jgi:hypothetical protein
MARNNKMLRDLDRPRFDANGRKLSTWQDSFNREGKMRDKESVSIAAPGKGEGV